MPTSTSTVAPLAVSTRVIIAKGCKARGVTKGATAVVKAVEPMGAEFGHNVRITLYFLNSFMSGKTVSFYARHINRLGDVFVSMNDGRPENRIEVRRA